MVSVMQLTLCVHAEQKSNQQNISSCVVIFTVLKDYNFLKTLRRLIQINSKLNENDKLILYCMVLKQMILNVLIKKFLNL